VISVAQVIQDSANMDASESDLCGDDLDIILCAEESGRAHGDCAEECDKPFHHYW